MRKPENVRIHVERFILQAAGATRRRRERQNFKAFLRSAPDFGVAERGDTLDADRRRADSVLASLSDE